MSDESSLSSEPSASDGGAAASATTEPWRITPINSRTGAVWRLTDREVAPFVDALQRNHSENPAAAVAFLKANGLLTTDGRLPKNYGGEE